MFNSRKTKKLRALQGQYGCGMGFVGRNQAERASQITRLRRTRASRKKPKHPSRLWGRLPGIDCGIVITLSAKYHGTGMAASAVPEIEDSAFRAQRLSAAVADNDSLVFCANLAIPAFRGLDHEGTLQCPDRPRGRIGTGGGALIHRSQISLPLNLYPPENKINCLSFLPAPLALRLFIRAWGEQGDVRQEEKDRRTRLILLKGFHDCLAAKSFDPGTIER